ncbi:hypothetical protein JQ625_10575 [Bradyrhizobium diazoefficiens]|nr:hypothetical protein [Bradyrhizobium diazoefficiens]MBR0775277.1 hypothetical protein [Bradyrhizobium diazoefficiens]
MMATASEIDDVRPALERLLEPLNGTLDDLLDAAADAGMLITQDRRQRLYLLAWRLAEADITFRDAHDAAVTLGSVLCATAEDQVSFARELNRIWREPVPAGFLDLLRGRRGEERSRPADRPAPRLAPALARLAARPLLIAILILTVVVIVLGLLVWSVAMFPGDQPSALPTLPNLPVRKEGDLLLAAALDVAQRMLLALPAAIAAWLAWTWWKPATRSLISREQGAAEQLERFTRPDFNALFRGTTVRLAFDTLRRAVRTESSRVDVPSSLRATVRAAGWPTIRRATQRNSLEVVLFVDREGVADHLAFLAQLLEDRLRAAGATVTRYDFRLIPTRLTQVSGRPEGTLVEDVERVVSRHVGQRLILVGDGHGLVQGNDLDGELRLRRLLGEFAQVHVLTPTPEECWEDHERRLLQAGFNVAFCDRQGLEDTARISTLVDWTEPLAALIRTIRGDGDPFLSHLEAEYHRYAADYPLIQPREGAPDGPIATTGLSALQIRALVSSLQAWMGSRPALRLLVAIAVFPSVKPAYTFAIADALRQDPDAPGAELGEELYARLARLPWLRDGRFPDWLRLALVRRLTDTEREAMARAHVKLLAPMAVAHGEVLAQASLEIARRSLRANMNPDHPMAERLFLATLFGQPPKSDLLRPQASAAMTERLGEQLKLASRIVGSGFFAVAILCFLFKDSIVLPLLAAAEQGIRTSISPLLPEIPPAIAAASVVCSLLAFFWPGRRAGTTAEAPAESIWDRLRREPWWLRPSLGATSLILSALSFKADFGRSSELPLATMLLSLATLANVVLERHPRWNSDLRVLPDVDEAGVSGAASSYRLGDIIASQAMLGPSLAAVGLLFLGGSVIFAMFAAIVILSNSWMGSFVTVPIASLAWMAYAVVLRRSVLGSWLLTAPDGTQRHILTDFCAAAVALSIGLVGSHAAELRSNWTSFGPVVLLLFTLLTMFLPFDALGLRPFATPAPQGGRVRANIAISFLTSALAVAAGGILAALGQALAIFLGVLAATIIVHFVASTALVRISGPSISQRERFVLSLRQIGLAKGLSVHAAMTVLLPPIALEALLWFENRPSVDRVFLGWFMLLAFWPLVRVFGAVPLVEALKARQSGKVPVALPIFQKSYLDSPWPMALVLLAVCLWPWYALATGRFSPWLQYVMLLAPWICVPAGYRYGRAAFGPMMFGLLPFVIGVQTKHGTLLAEPAFVVAMLFWVRFAGDPALRQALLARETLPLSDLVMLAVAFAFTLTIQGPPGEGLVLNYEGDWLVLTAAFLIGLSRMPVRGFLLMLGCLALLRIGIDWTTLTSKEFGSALWARGIIPSEVKANGLVLLYGLPWVTAVCAFAATLLARLGLRAAMLADGSKATQRGSEPFASIISRNVLSERTPFILFFWGQVTWLAGLVLFNSEIELDALSNALDRNPIVVCAGLMIGLSASRLRDLGNNFLVIVPLGALSWFTLHLGAPPETASIPFVKFFGAFVWPYLLPCLFGFALRACAEGRWRLWTGADVLSAAQAFWATLSRRLPGRAPEPELESEAPTVDGASAAGPASAASEEQSEASDVDPVSSPDGEVARKPSKKPTMETRK